MTCRLLACAVAILLPVGAASAQEVKGAERTEISSAIFGGGMLFMQSPAVDGSASRSHVLSVAFTRNLNRWIGVEADGGIGLGRRQTQRLYGTAPTEARTSNVMLYSGNVVVNPFSSERLFVPYLSGGLGALTTLADEDPLTSGLAPRTTYLTGSAGGGVRWFPIPHWGVPE